MENTLHTDKLIQRQTRRNNSFGRSASFQIIATKRLMGLKNKQPSLRPSQQLRTQKQRQQTHYQIIKEFE